MSEPRNERTRLIDYRSVPFPEAARIARRHRQLLEVDIDILGALYHRAILEALHQRASLRTSRVQITLVELAEEACAPCGYSLNYLGKRLRFLRGDGWLSYTSKPGQHGHVYDIRLNPEPIRVTEGVSPRSGEAEARTESAIAPRGEQDQSEEAQAAPAEASPRSRPRSEGFQSPVESGVAATHRMGQSEDESQEEACQSEEKRAANPGPERKSAAAVLEPVPALRLTKNTPVRNSSRDLENDSSELSADEIIEERELDAILAHAARRRVS